MDLKELCRTCLRPSGTMMSIFDSIQVPSLEFTKYPILEILRIFTDISISRNDGLPEKICWDCFEKVHQSYAFKLKFNKSVRIWEQLIEDTKTMDEHYIEADIEPLETEKTHATFNNEQLEEFKPGIVKKKFVLVQQLKQEPEIEINMDEGSFNETDLEDEKCSKSERKEKLFPCEICLRNFRYKRNLDVHMTVHVNERTKKFKCTTCPKSYFSKHVLNRHIKLIHGGVTPFKCEACSKTFRYKSILMIHMQKIHGDEPKIKFECTTCLKFFKRNHYLKQHIRIHTGEKPFQCEICSRKFADKYYLKVHKRRIHGVESQNV